MNPIRKWFINSRPTALPQSLLPALLAFFLAMQSENFVWWLGLIGVVGVVFAHLGLNLFDDYFDFKKKKSDYREELVHEGFRARIGKTPYLVSGESTLKQLLVACCIFCGIAVALGAIVFVFRGEMILYIAAVAAFLGIFYSAPPLRLSYHGLGELVIGVMFGPLVMLGVYYAACSEFNEMILLISLAAGLLVTNVVYIHSMLDVIPDEKIGKMTLAVVLRKKKYQLVALACIEFIPFIIIILGVVFRFFSPWFLLTFVTFPMAVSLFYMMVEFTRNPDRKFAPRFWMGPLNKWERICEAGIDWFMIRWLTARNLMTFFCLVCIIVSFLM
ncbi:prenyltransferase [Paludibacteraceae bacterium OttesenSCG-928-F17]|nr:prenyltransferase [Paludibacteraceae bacterium OttesenSCG-928-F17]